MIEENYKEERYTERVNQGGVWGSFKRKFFRSMKEISDF